MQANFTKQHSGEWVEGAGLITRLLSDDNEDDRHQRFVLDLRNGQTVLVAHNLDIGQRVPVGMGDRIRFRGLYEWNEEGGLIHWTHRDLHTSEDAGYISWHGKIYQ